jgi:hypothetical protein
VTMPAYFVIDGSDDVAALLKLPADYFQCFRSEPATARNCVGIWATGARRSFQAPWRPPSPAMAINPSQRGRRALTTETLAVRLRPVWQSRTQCRGGHCG